jgi:hypothetical protein
MQKMLGGTLLIAALALGCGDNKSTSQPTPAAPPLSGTWSGELVLQGITTRMTWSLTQTNNTVTGPVLVLLPTGTVLMNGTLNGTLNGSTLTYTIAIPAGGIPALPACTGQLGGTTTASLGTVSTLTGSYAVTSSTCASPFTSGNFVLTKM